MSASALFERELKKLIDAEIERLREIVVGGDAIPDYAKYQRAVGQIAAYRCVMNDYFPETQKILAEKN